MITFLLKRIPAVLRIAAPLWFPSTEVSHTDLDGSCYLSSHVCVSDTFAFLSHFNRRKVLSPLKHLVLACHRDKAAENSVIWVVYRSVCFAAVCNESHLRAVINDFHLANSDLRYKMHYKAVDWHAKGRSACVVFLQTYTSNMCLSVKT